MKDQILFFLKDIINPKLDFVLNELLNLDVQGDTIDLVATILIASGLVPFLYKSAQKIYLFIEHEKLRKDLFPLVEPSEVSKALKFYVPTKGQNISPSEELKENSKHTFTAKEKLIPYFLNDAFKQENKERYYLILADSGMGKTTFLLNLFIRYQRRFWKKRYTIKFFPFGNPETENEIFSIPKNDRKRTILLLDAFDENPKIDKEYNKKIRDLLIKAWEFRQIVITCRTQFFPSENEEPYETGVFRPRTNSDNTHYFKKIYISSFNDKDIKIYLNKKYPIWKLWKYSEKREAKKIMAKCPNLMIRPMLLSYVDIIVKSNTSKKEKIKLDPTDIYEILVNWWIKRESFKIGDKDRKEFIRNMNKLSTEMAVNIYLNRRKRKGLLIKYKDLSKFSKDLNINLSQLEVAGKSLLNRDAKGRYKFAHKSILEYLLAKHAIENNNFAEGVLHFQDLKNFTLAKSFYEELNYKRNIDQ